MPLHGRIQALVVSIVALVAKHHIKAQQPMGRAWENARHTELFGCFNNAPARGVRDTSPLVQDPIHRARAHSCRNGDLRKASSLLPAKGGHDVSIN